MTALLIIYLLGCIVTFIFNYNYTLNKWGEITISDIAVFFITSLLSWPSLAIGFAVFYGDVEDIAEDKVIVSKKPKEHETRR